MTISNIFLLGTEFDMKFYLKQLFILLVSKKY